MERTNTRTECYVLGDELIFANLNSYAAEDEAEDNRGNEKEIMPGTLSSAASQESTRNLQFPMQFIPMQFIPIDSKSESFHSGPLLSVFLGRTG
jgi:hypothetical protein